MAYNRPLSESIDDARLRGAVIKVNDHDEIINDGYLSPSELNATMARPTVQSRLVARQGQVAMLRRIINKANRYYLNTWYPARFPGSSPITALGGSEEWAVRPPASVAVALAAAISTGNHDPALTGITETDARTAALRIINGVAYCHKANGGTWGGTANTPPSPTGGVGWQDALWAAQCAHAAYLLRGSLDATTHELVSKMITWEANRMLTWTIPFWKARSGAVNYAGDSKSEEISWNAMALMVALAYRQGHVNSPAWSRKVAEAGVAMCATPADLTDSTLVNGINPSVWLNGTNVNPDGTIINHDIVHPAYMAAPHSMVLGALSAWAKEKMPAHAALLRHADLVWGAYSQVEFSAPPYDAPGGSIYPPGKSELYYPDGSDWGTVRIVETAVHDVYASLFDLDGAYNTNADEWALQHLQREIDLQARSADGRTYEPGEDSYAGIEQQAGWIAGLGLLSLLAPPVEWSNDPVPTPTTQPWVTAVKTIVNPSMWLTMDSVTGSVFADSTDNARDAPVVVSSTGNAIQSVASIVPGYPQGGAALFGGSYLSMPNAAWMNASGIYTILVTVSATGAGATDEMMVARSGTGGNNVFHLETTPGGGGGVAKATVFNSASTGFNLVGTTNVRDGNPHLIALVSTGTNALLYVDGVLDGSVAVAARTDGTNPLVIGARAAGQYKFAGTLDELTITIGTALDATQIAAVHDAWATAP